MNIYTGIRKVLNLTQREMCRLCDISPSTWCLYEAERRRPTPEIAWRIIIAAERFDLELTLEDFHPRPTGESNEVVSQEAATTDGGMEGGNGHEGRVDQPRG